MELLTACLFQALGGEPEALCEQAQKARGFRGQALAARRISNSLRTHPDFARRIDEHQWGSRPKPVDGGAEIQDPYSLRCAPQIFGAFQEAHWHVAQVITRELNASTDNPLVFPDTGMVIHCGNFYGQQIAMVSDYLRMGLIKMALLADRQIERLLNWRYSRGLPPLLAGGEPGLNSGLAGAQLLATSLAAEARLAGHAGLHPDHFHQRQQPGRRQHGLHGGENDARGAAVVVETGGDRGRRAGPGGGSARRGT